MMLLRKCLCWQLPFLMYAWIGNSCGVRVLQLHLVALMLMAALSGGVMNGSTCYSCHGLFNGFNSFSASAISVAYVLQCDCSLLPLLYPHSFCWYCVLQFCCCNCLPSDRESMRKATVTGIHQSMHSSVCFDHY